MHSIITSLLEAVTGSASVCRSDGALHRRPHVTPVRPCIHSSRLDHLSAAPAERLLFCRRPSRTVVLTVLLCAASLCPYQAASAGQDTTHILALPDAFPADGYTPHGYIDNPHHSMVHNRSGVIRSYPPLGFGWWRADANPGAYGEGSRDHVNYLSILQLGVSVGDSVFLTTGDFQHHGAVLASAYHTKHLVSYDWKCGSVTVHLRFFLPFENSLVCQVDLLNSGRTGAQVRLDAAAITKIGTEKWWGSDGITARHLHGDGISVSKIWAYGDVFALGSTLTPVAHLITAKEEEWGRWIRRNDTASISSMTAMGQGPLWTTHAYRVRIPANGRTAALLCLSRGKNEQAVRGELARALREAIPAAQGQLAKDGAFWSSCPTLTGSWPSAWKRGWVYDFETLRMNVRPPVGIFTHPWDGMQVHSPRVVLGETCLDMMALAYADPVLAREVVEGTFADALAPNIPCAREDGSVNMISSDGSECGTAPMWGFPFRVVRSLFLASGDTAWIVRLYPHLKAYALWWLKNRTDKEGWLHCNNSWESGQDGSRRFLVAEHNEGAVADFVRTVDVEASMAEALGILGEFARFVPGPEESSMWKELAARRARNTQSMFFEGEFRDIDGRSGAPIVLKGHNDVMMLTPLVCGVATPDQQQAVKPMFRYFLDNPRSALEWPPLLYTYVEAAWNAGEREAAATAVASTATRVYGRTDARVVTRSADSGPFSYRIPGVANEFWPLANVSPGGENYGWGATLPAHIIRNILGFREHEAAGDSADDFVLAPCLSPDFFRPGQTYGIRNLHYRGLTFDLSITCRDSSGLQVAFHYRSLQSVAVTVLEQNGESRVAAAPANPTGVLTLRGRNAAIYRFRLSAELRSPSER